MNRIEITFNSPKELEEYIKSELKTIPNYGYSRTSDKSVSIQAIYLQSIQIKK
jgi:hypothetical protein